MNATLIISQHAKLRAKERLRWKLATLQRMAARAVEVGLGAEDVPADVRLYLEARDSRFKRDDETRIHGGVVFVIERETLVTIFPLPATLMRQLLPR